MKIDILTPVENIRFVVMDVETTGLNYKYDRICEISMSIVKDFKEINGFTALINPQVPIPQSVSQIHGITDEMVLKSPKFEEVANQILDIIYDGVLVGHNIEFDFNFLKAELERIGYAMPEVYKIDTLKLSRRFCKSLCDYKLETVARSMNLFSNDWHRAENDVLITVRVFENILRTLIKENGVTNLKDLINIME